MSFTGLAVNQAVSYTNLQDAVNNGIFTLVSAITSTGQESTKSYVGAHVSGFNANYPPYAIKASNQLIVQGDIYNTGNFILDAAYGMSFTSMTGSVGGLPTFTFPVTTGNTTLTYKNTIAAQTITLGITGTRVSPPQKVVLLINGIQVDCQDLTVNGAQTKVLTLPNTIYAPSSIKISMNLSACVVAPPIVFTTSVSVASISRTTGQYQIVGLGNSDYQVSYPLDANYICTSSDYGATWTKRTPYGYWTTVSVSDDGQYMLAGDSSGYAYISSNYGASWTQTLSYPTTFLTPNQNFVGSAISNAGTYMYLSTTTANGSYTPKFLVSTNQGASWSDVSWGAINSNYNRPTFGLTISSTGQYVFAGFLKVNSPNWEANVAISSNSGSTASNITIATGALVVSQPVINSISSSANGANVLLNYFNNTSSGYVANYLLASTNNGTSWSNITGGTTGTKIWRQSSINNSGTGYAVIQPNYLSLNTSYLQKVTTLSSVDPITTPGSRVWLCTAISGNGTYILAGHYNGLYRSADSGTTWNAL